MKAKQKTIRVASAGKNPTIKVPLWWRGKWVAVNSNHYVYGWTSEGPIEIERYEYKLTHIKTGYSIGDRYQGVPLHKVRAMAEKLDALGAGCWNFSKPQTVKTKRWVKKYKPIIFKILGKELSDESKAEGRKQV